MLFNCIFHTEESKSSALPEATIRGLVTMPGNVPSKGDTIAFAYNENYHLTGSLNSVYKAISDKNGNFSVKLPSYSLPTAMIGDIFRSDKTYSRIYDVDKRFFESGDNIFMRIFLKRDGRFDSVSYSGHGCEKYNVSAKLSRLMIDYNAEWKKLYTKIEYAKAEKYEFKLIQLTNLIERFVNQKSEIIKKGGLSKQMEKLMLYDNADFYHQWTFRLFVYSTSERFKNNSDVQRIIKKVYRENKYKFINLYDNLMMICPDYLFYQPTTIAMALRLDSDDNIVTVEKLYKKLGNDYPKKMSELLIGNLFVSGYGIIQTMPIDDNNIDSLMKDGTKYIKRPKNLQIYLAKQRLTKGSEIYNGFFIGLNGEKVDLKSLRGKVVLIDMWGVGCSACAKYFQIFHRDVYPSLKNNKDFVYLSISNDRKFERWQSGITSGIYTSLDYLNVSTGELGLNHPFAKYYAIESSPFLLLIDKQGKIYSQILGSPLDDEKRILSALSMGAPELKSK